MKKVKFGALTACIVMLLCTLPADAKLFRDTITVDPSVAVKERVMFGFGQDWSGYSYLFNNSETYDFSDEWLGGMKRYDMHIPIYRMGGDSSNGFYWKTRIGEIYDRGQNGFDNKGYAEWYKTLSRITPEVKLNVVFNMNDTVENNKDLVRFLTLMPDDKNAVGSDGVNWAQKRVDLGIAEPIPIFAFELGNELYPKKSYTEITVDEVTEEAEKYADACRELIGAVREVNSDIKLGVQTYSSSMISYTDSSGTTKNENEARCRAWNETAVSAVKDEIDYAIHHDYFNINLKSSIASIDKRDDEYAVINDYIDGTDIKIILTETGSYLSGGYDTPYSNSMKDALALSRFYIKMFSMDKIAEVIQYGFNGYEGSGKAEIPDSNGNFGGEWWMSYRYCKDGKFRASATGMVGNLFAELSAGEPLSTTVSNISGRDTAAQAFKMPDGSVNIVIAPDYENQESDLETEISLSGYKAVQYTVIGGKTLTSDNNSQTTDGVVRKISPMNEANPTVLIPKYSVVSIKFVADGEADYDDDIGIMRISASDGVSEITDYFYDGEYGDNSAVLLILKQGAVYPDITESDIVVRDFAEIVDNKAYFCTELPEKMPCGEYTAVVGSGNIFHEERFTYRENFINSIGAVCENGHISVNLEFDENSENGTYTVAAIYGSGNFTDLDTHKFAYVGTFEKSGNTAKFEFDMPSEMLSGTYSLIVGNGNGTESTVFEYSKSGERFVIDGIPTDKNGNDLKAAESTADINVTIRNVSDETAEAAVYACVYKGGDLEYVTRAVSKSLSPTEREVVPLHVDAEDADLIKIVVWEKGGMSPFTSAYYIK